MPKYRIETNRGTFEIEANREPTASEIESYVSEQSNAPTEPAQAQPMAQQAPAGQSQSRFVPEIVAGNEQQMAQQRARNIQGQLGLANPVSTTETVPLLTRFKAGFAPTAQERQAYFETEYGKGSFIPLSSNRALIRIPDKESQFKWVVDDPKGLDAGDLAEIASKGPEIAAGFVSTLSKTPGTAGGIAKLAQVSGVSALGSNVYGAVQDAVFRGLTGQAINPAEIASRRAKGTVLETMLGVAAPKAVEKVVQVARSRSELSKNVAAFIDEGNAAKQALQKSYNPSSSAELADAIRSSNPAKLSASEAGDILAESLTQTDRVLRDKSVGMAQKAATSLEAKAMARIDQATSAIALEPGQAGMAAIGGAKQKFIDAKQATDMLYEEALGEIGSTAKWLGTGNRFVSLDNTKKVIRDAAKLFPSTVSGEQSALLAPFRTTVVGLQDIVGAKQDLGSARQLRSQIGAVISGAKSDLFPGLNIGQAKQIYKSLSQDIDNSVAKLTGNGAAKLRVANNAYKDMIEPIEASEFIGKLVNDGFSNPEDVVKILSRGGTADWAAAKAVIPPNTFNQLKRSVVNELMGTAKVKIGNAEISDIGKLAQSLNSIDGSVKNMLFNGSNRWQFIEQVGKQVNSMKNMNGIFMDDALPAIGALNEAMSIAEREGINKANSYYKNALKFAAERRSNLTSSLVSQINNGNVVHVAERPAELFEGLVLSGKYRPEYVKSVMSKLPVEQQKNIADTAFQTLFDKARILSQSTVESGKNTYSFDQMLNNVFRNKQQAKAVEAVIGKDRLEVIKNWTKYEMANSILQAKASQQGRRVTGLIGRLPYKNLAMAGFASYALEQASGRAFLSKTNPSNVALFSDARLLQLAPRKTSAGISIIQKAMEKPEYGDYLQMMGDFNQEQQAAIDDYLLNR